MQEELSRRYNEGKTVKETNPGRFAGFAQRTSGYSEEGKNRMLTDLETAMQFREGRQGTADFKIWKAARAPPADGATGGPAALTEKAQKPAAAGADGTGARLKQRSEDR